MAPMPISSSRSTSSAVERFDNRARESFEHVGHTTVYRGELLRHPVYTRVLHWMVALFFFLALFTGFAVYLPWLFRWFTPFFGGTATGDRQRSRGCSAGSLPSSAADRSAASCTRGS